MLLASGFFSFVAQGFPLHVFPLSLGNIEASEAFPQPQESGSAQNNARLLNPDEVVKREIAGGEAQTFRLPLTQGQFLNVVVEQKGVDLVVKLFGPDAKPLILMDSPNGMYGPESVSVVAQTAGDYMVEVRSNEKWAAAGSYELRVASLRQPTEADMKRLAAERAFVEGQSLRLKGTAESRQAAVEKYKESLALWRSLGEKRGEAYLLYSIGKTYWALGRFAETREYFNQALSIWKERSDALDEAFVLNELGGAYRDLDDPLKSLDYYQQSLSLRREAGSQWGAAQVLNNIGLIYARTGSYKKALEYYEQAITLWETAHDRNQEAITLNNIGGALDEMGDPQQAIEKYERALKILQEIGNDGPAASLSNNIAKIYDTWGDSQKALALYESALEIHRKLKNRGGEAQVLDNIGMLYAGWGDAQRAMEKFDESLPIREELKSPRGKAFTLNNKGYAFALQGNYGEALKYYELALPFREQAKDKQGEASTLGNMGLAYTSLGDWEKAIEYYQRALKVQRETENLRGQAVILNRLGQAYTSSGDLSKAPALFEQALPLWKTVGDKNGEAMTLYGLAQVAGKRGDLDAARVKVEEAIGIVESLRTRVTSQQLRTTYLATKQDYYELYIDIRMRLFDQRPSTENLEAALQASERSRARGLLDLLAEAIADIRRGADPALVESKNRLEQRIDAIAEKLINFRNAKPRPENAPFVTHQIEELTAEYERLLNSYDEIQANIKLKSPRYAQLVQPQPLKLSGIQELLSDDTVLLEYALGDERSYVWAITRKSITGKRLASREAIEKLAGRVKELMSSRPRLMPNETPEQFEKRSREAQREYQQQAVELSNLVLTPVASEMAGAKNLLIVSDGLLRYIPFEALPVPNASGAQPDTGKSLVGASGARTATDGSVPLMVEKYILTYQLSASVMAILRTYPRVTATRPVAVFADPVFDSNDDRVQIASKGRGLSAPAQAYRGSPNTLRGDLSVAGERPSFERLISSLREANEIIKLLPGGAVMKATDFNANRAAAMRPELSQYKIVHFATHGLLDDKRPELSSIVLSLVDKGGNPQDGYLRLNDIYNLNLPVEMVVLSACRTGVGKEVKGEGIIGLTRGFMYAGAARVVASLWKVDTDDTAALMGLFYQQMLKYHKSPSAALQAAQVEMMNRPGKSEPYHWAGFVLQGEWR